MVFTVKHIQMKNRQIVLLLVLFIGSFLACEKDDSSSEGVGAVKLISLMANDTVLNAWQVTKVFATAEGQSLIYNWEADHGEINGSGAQIEYMAGTCCTGTNTITCTVSNSENSDSKQIKLLILPFK